MKELLRAVSHLALQSQPVTEPEMRELVLRHLLSTPEDVGQGTLTKHLFYTYLQMLCISKDDGVAYHSNRFVSVDETGIKALFRKNYILGIEHGLSEIGNSDTIRSFDSTYFPANLPATIMEYPKDIVEQFAAVMGYMTATGRRAA